MDDLHLKLQLTAEDARYVREKFLVAVDDKINYHLPAQLVFDDGAQQQQEDPMRSKVEDLVKDVSTRVCPPRQSSRNLTHAENKLS